MAVAASAALVVLLGACSNSGPEFADDSGLEWQQTEEGCMRQTEEGPVQRAINYTDPELCGREVRERPRERVRVPPPDKDDSN